MEICGIDEAGRGPIAGPLVIAGCVLFEDIKGIKDSKKITPKKREELYEKIINNSIYHIEIIYPEVIDKKGLSYSIKYGLKKVIENIRAKRYLFDGNANFGIKKIESIVKGDTKIKEISAASILAKVRRDSFMINIDVAYPHNFKKHKGYPTKEHIEEIKKYGLSYMHRKSYKLKALNKGNN